MIKNDAKTCFRDVLLGLAIIVVVLCSFFTNDDKLSLFSALFGIIYTVLIGRGLFIAYVFGILGTLCTIFISYKYGLWGYCSLHLLYYLPMMMAGFFSWKKHIDKEKNEVIKKRLRKGDIIIFFVVCSIVSAIISFLLFLTGDASPILDSITVVFSVFAMFLTVGRYVEQWIVWIFVDFLMVIMWFLIFQNGAHAFAILISRVVYLILGIYFFKKWKEDEQR